MFRAYVASEPRDRLEFNAIDAGPIGPHEVEISAFACRICHSDLSMLNNDWEFTAYPFVPGHEVVGTIAAVGDQVTRVKAGKARYRIVLENDIS